MAGREHPKIHMLPHVTIGYSALQEWDPAGATVPKSTALTGSHTALLHACSGYFALSHTFWDFRPEWFGIWAASVLPGVTSF